MQYIYLDSNGITIKCPNAAIGYTGVINGVTYTVVDNTTIRTEIANSNCNLCTTLVTNMAGDSNTFSNFLMMNLSTLISVFGILLMSLICQLCFMAQQHSIKT